MRRRGVARMRTRTMVYLEREELQALRAEARSLGISLAELMRRLVKRHLEEGPVPTPVSPETYLKLIALGSSGQSDVAEHHDAYLGQALRGEHLR